MDRLIIAALRGAGITEGSALDLIIQERFRQESEEGYTAKHDAEHSGGHLLLLACAYALNKYDNASLEVASVQLKISAAWKEHSGEAPKYFDKVKDLKRAGALIAAELDRVLAEEGGG